jgi:nucleoside-diphosphate-sugar epimerase
MKVLVTGHHGYIGSVLTDVFVRAGHQVTGLDSYLYDGCTLGKERGAVRGLCKDVRDVEERDVRGYDAIVHLAALSNDPLGDLDEACTFDINHRASVRLAELAKAAGVPRFLFASSCSLYGASTPEALLTETAEFHPLTPYGLSKVLVESDVSAMADDRFSPTFLRNATAYGMSPRLRADVVVNNLVGVAYTTGEVVLQSDGTPWRPLVHVEDISRAFLAVLEAPRDLVHNEAFNVGRTEENYQIRELADMVVELMPGCSVQYAEGAGPDPRCYRVNCDKLPARVPQFQPQWTVRRGMRELYDAFAKYGLTAEAFAGFKRIRHIQKLQRESLLDFALRRRVAVPAT